MPSCSGATNTLLQSKMLSSPSVQRVLTAAGRTELAALRSAGQLKTAAMLSQDPGGGLCICFEKLLDEVVAAHPGSFLELLRSESAERQPAPPFPLLTICAAVEEQRKTDGGRHAVTMQVLSRTSLAVFVQESG